MRSQHNEEDVPEPFATMSLNLDGSDGGSRNLKWIEFFHSFALPSQQRCPRATMAGSNTETADEPQSAKIKRTSAMTPTPKPISSTACLMVKTATA